MYKEKPEINTKKILEDMMFDQVFRADIFEKIENGELPPAEIVWGPNEKIEGFRVKDTDGNTIYFESDPERLAELVRQNKDYMEIMRAKKKGLEDEELKKIDAASE